MPSHQKSTEKTKNIIDMKAKEGFNLRDVCGHHIIVAEGVENIDFNNIIKMNDSSSLLWERAQQGDFTLEDLAQLLMDNYEIDDDTPLPRDRALQDAAAVVQQWREAGILDE